MWTPASLRSGFHCCQRHPTFYGGNVTLTGAGSGSQSTHPHQLGRDTDGGAITIVPTYEYTNIVVTGYAIDGSALTDPELGRQWVLDSNFWATSD